MSLYSIYAKLVVEFESDRPVEQIEAILNSSAPALRRALKQAWRDALARDGTGKTRATLWHYHVQGVRGSDGRPLVLDHETIDEMEP